MVKKKSSAIAGKTTKTKTAKKAVKKAPSVSAQRIAVTQVDTSAEDSPELTAETHEVAEATVATPSVAAASAAPAPAVEARVPAPGSAPEQTTLPVRLTEALLSKLRRSAQEEGVDLDTLVHELLSEGVTLRAWEIIERKNAMRAPSTGNSPYQQPGQNRSGGNNNRRHNNNNNNNRRGGGGGNAPSGTAWMEDKAQFLEYVRNQEKRRR